MFQLFLTLGKLCYVHSFEIDCKIFRSTEEKLEMVKKSLILVGVCGSERFCHVIIEHSQLCNPRRF